MSAAINDLMMLLAGSPPATFLRGSFWVYPVVNASHILGISLLLGAIIPFDLRLLGFFKVARLRTLALTLVPTAAFGLGLAAVSGVLLFIVKPAEYAASTLFIYKLVVIGVGLINIIVVRTNKRWADITTPDAGLAAAAEGDAHLKLAACISLLAWLGTMVLGRFVGYFM